MSAPKTTRRRLLATAASTAALAPLAAAVATSAQAADPALDGLLDAFLKEDLDHSPETATYLGLDTGPRAGARSRLDDRSLQGREDAEARNRGQLHRLRAIDRRGLSGMDLVNYDTLVYVAARQADADRRFGYGSPGAGQPYVISQLTGAYQSIPDFLDSQHVIHDKADAEAYLARLSAFADALDAEGEQSGHDASRGASPPDFALDKTLVQLRALHDAKPADSTLVQSLVNRTREKKIDGDWGTAATAIYESQVRPAVLRQIELMEKLRKTASHDAGVWRLPQGQAYYAAALQIATTTSISPAEVHRTGLELVASLSSQADVLLRAQGMSQGSVGQRLRALYDAPRFRYPNTDEGKTKLIADLNVKVERVQARLPKYFGVLPKSKVDIRRVPKATEAGAPGGYYMGPSLDGSRPGSFYINLRDTAEVPSWTLPTLVYHEAIPGHHLQIAISTEVQGLPTLRKLIGFNAYQEGWALYAEQLAGEMGLYEDDPFGRIGYLHDAMLRAVRLVIDSGVHAMRWSREQAVAYFVDTLGDQEASAVTEVERYCVWPGQACSYMVGKLDWLRNRDKARAALGARFDIRAFHDAGLTCGAVPLAVLDGVFDRYIQAAR